MKVSKSSGEDSCEGDGQCYCTHSSSAGTLSGPLRDQSEKDTPTPAFHAGDVIGQGGDLQDVVTNRVSDTGGGHTSEGNEEEGTHTKSEISTGTESRGV